MAIWGRSEFMQVESLLTNKSMNKDRRSDWISKGKGLFRSRIWEVEDCADHKFLKEIPEIKNRAKRWGKTFCQPFQQM